MKFQVLYFLLGIKKNIRKEPFFSMLDAKGFLNNAKTRAARIAYKKQRNVCVSILRKSKKCYY